ncbi:polysaccharide pyruvyl transferase family protein [Pseudoclavibacter terrae]|uniref:polysaccharide pyruvyl transferase family protein n=1 Tax=Pseudoclavibacter terrae TaxID=1530195 RepID=UPI002330ECF5|nr:polysaccharide pyruvyl transferase family protein [Pseudoclavibacter terrae]
MENVAVVAGVDVVHWNPRKLAISGPVGRLIRLRKPVDNFGDLLGPLIVEHLVKQRGKSQSSHAMGGPRLLSVGSIMRLAEPGDFVWGSGVNGKSIDVDSVFPALDVRAVRGPLTRSRLMSDGIAVPETYGDPGLLVPELFPELKNATRLGITIVPNLHDWPTFKNDPRAVNPRGDLHSIIKRIAGSELVVGSSLHGIVVAESFGVPARLVRAGSEPVFKYEDYYEGTGRRLPSIGASVEQAIDLSGAPPLQWSPHPLLEAFPTELWR